MNRPITTIVAIGAVFLTSACGGSAAGDDTVTLKLAESFPDTHIVSQLLPQKFAERVEKESGGRLKIEHYPSEQLGKASDMIDVVENGTADIGFWGAAYLSDRLPLTTVGTLPGVYDDAVDGSQTLYDMSIGSLGEAELEPLGSISLMAFTMNQYQLMTADQKIESVKDIRGLRVRTSGGYQESTAEQFGAVPVSMAGPEMYQAFQRGTINATFVTTDSMAPYELQEVLGYGTDNLSLGGFPGYYAISEQAFAGLDEELQKVVVDVGKDLSYEFGGEMAKYQAKVEKQFAEDGFEIYSVDDQVKEDVEAVTGKVQDQWRDDMDSRDLPGSEILDEFSKDDGE